MFAADPLAIVQSRIPTQVWAVSLILAVLLLGGILEHWFAPGFDQSGEVSGQILDDDGTDEEAQGGEHAVAGLDPLAFQPAVARLYAGVPPTAMARSFTASPPGKPPP
jgi:hypothetical protein